MALVGKPKGSQKSGGRVAGTPNKATTEAREAIATFVNGNSHRLQEWLDRIADGIPEFDADGNIIDYKLTPNPQKAFELYQSVIEYHVPKLARTEQTITGADGGPVEHSLKVKFGE